MITKLEASVSRPVAALYQNLWGRGLNNFRGTLRLSRRVETPKTSVEI